MESETAVKGWGGGDAVLLKVRKGVNKIKYVRCLGWYLEVSKFSL